VTTIARDRVGGRAAWGRAWEGSHGEAWRGVRGCGAGMVIRHWNRSGEAGGDTTNDQFAAGRVD